MAHHHVPNTPGVKSAKRIRINSNYPGQQSGGRSGSAVLPIATIDLAADDTEDDDDVVFIEEVALHCPAAAEALGNALEAGDKILWGILYFHRDKKSAYTLLQVVKSIVEFLGVKQLKNFRAINPTCYEEATKAMCDSTFVKIRDSKLNINSKDNPIQNFSSCFVNTEILPFSGIIINKFLAGYLTLTDSSNGDFLESFQDDIKALSLPRRRDHGALTKAKFLNLFLKFPNIGRLIIAKDAGLAPDSCELPGAIPLRETGLLNLTVININDYTLKNRSLIEALEELVAAATNLEKIERMPECLMPAILETDKVRCVPSLTFEPKDRTLHLYDKFAALQPQLRTMVDHTQRFKLTTENNYQSWNTFCKILKSSQDSLEILGLEATTWLCPGVQLPLLPQVTELILYNLLPSCIKTQLSCLDPDCFPNVRSVKYLNRARNLQHVILNEIEMSDDGNERFIMPMDSVQELYVDLWGRPLFRSDQVISLYTKFSHLTQITVTCDDEVSDPGSLVWCIPETVNTLIIKYRLHKHAHGGKLDRFFTQIPGDPVKRLQGWTCPVAKILGSWPSLLRLRNLTTLEIHWADNSYVDSYWNYNCNAPQGPLLSSITTKYIFDVMPRLKLVFFFPSRFRDLELVAGGIQKLSPAITIDFDEEEEFF